MPMLPSDNQKADESLSRLAAYRSQTNVVPAEVARRLRERYLVTSRDLVLSESLERPLADLGLMMQDGTRFEARGIVVTAGSGSGKSHAVRRLLSKHPLFDGYGRKGSGCLAIGVRCKGAFTLGRLGTALSAAAGYPIRNERHENIIWDKLRSTLKHRGIILVYIDELNSLLRNANIKERDKIVDMLKGLQNDEIWPVIVILSGTPRIEEIIRKHDPDDELTRRMNWIAFDPLKLPRDNAMIASHVGALCREARIPFDEIAFRTGLAPRLIHAARYQLGSSIELSVKAIELALLRQCGGLEMEHYATVFARENKVTFENNPFLVGEWASVKIYDRDDDEFMVKRLDGLQPKRRT